MLNKKTVDAYRKIKAPDSLRDKILSMEAAHMSRARQPVYRRVTVLAAAGFLLFVCCLSVVINLFPRAPLTEVKDAGGVALTRSARVLTPETVEYEPGNTILIFDPRIAAVTARSLTETAGRCIYFSFSYKTTAALSVDAGSILVYDADKDVYVDAGKETVISGGCELYWQLPEESADAAYAMGIKTEESDASIVIQYDSKTGTYTGAYVNN